MIRLLTIIGARPQIIKAAAISRAVREKFADQVEEHILHTGQHYDANMSEVFFRELGIPEPDYNLHVGSGSHGVQTARIIEGIESVLTEQHYDGIIVYGDTNSTLAAAVAASKIHVPVFHVEAGLRSFNMGMPEEINRMVTDSLADYMFTTSDVANENLQRLGAILMENKNNENTHSNGLNGLECNQPQTLTSELAAFVTANTPNPLSKEQPVECLQKPTKTVQQQVWFVGNVMIDTLLANRARFRKPEVWDELGLKDKEFIVMTMHRPANVDEENHLRAMMEQIIDNVHGLPVIFPIHPRTAKLFYGLWGSGAPDRADSHAGDELAKRFPNLHIVEPRGYLEFNYLVERAKAVVTDSGGITEETTVMGVPCITLRDNTERPETCTVGTNELIGTNPAAIKPALDKLFAGEWKKGAIPELWDGKTAERIISILADL